MNNGTETEQTFEDVNFEDHTSTGGGDWDTVPTSSYDLEIIGFKETKKTERKLQSDFAMKQKTNPDIRFEDIDQYQWEWQLQIIGGEDAGIILKDWTTRTFHENSRAGKIAAAAVGIDKYDVNVLRQYGGTRALMHKKVRCYVEEKEGTDGKMRNYLKVYSRIPEPRQRPTRTNTPTTPNQPVTSPQGRTQRTVEDVGNDVAASMRQANRQAVATGGPGNLDDYMDDDQVAF